MSLLKTVLAHPATRGLDLDDPKTTELRKTIIQRKTFLRKTYTDWYRILDRCLPQTAEPALEIGTGAGFAREHIPHLLTSDVMLLKGYSLVCNGLTLPFRDETLRAVLLCNVFHHLNNPVSFFSETYRVVRPGGVLAMIEPWVTPFSAKIYSHLHHEPFDPETSSWLLPESGPLSGGNDALPWIVFGRDRKDFHDLKLWHIDRIQPMMPFRYLLSGGVSMRSIVPGWMYGPVAGIEAYLPDSFIAKTAMFALIICRKPQSKNGE